MGWVRLLRPWVRLLGGAVTEEYRVTHRLLFHRVLLGGSWTSPTSNISYSSVRTLIKKSRNTKEVDAALEKQDNPKIQVFGLGDELMAVLSKKQAKARADARGLKLVEIDGTAKPFPVYQLMTGKDLHKQQMEQRQLKKGKTTEKSFRLAAKISDHDLAIKLKQIQENIMKGNRVKLTVHTSKSISEGSGQERTHVLKVVSEHLQQIAAVSKATDNGKDLTVIFRPMEGDNSEGS